MKYGLSYNDKHIALHNLASINYLASYTVSKEPEPEPPKPFSFNINLNGQWVEETASPVFDGYRLFKSNSNWHVADSSAIMYVSGFKNLDDSFEMKYISDSEGSYDYLRIYDGANTLIASANGTSGKYTTLSNYGTYTATSATVEGLGTVKFTYRKDASINKNTDRAYVAFPSSAIGEVTP